MAGKLTFAQLVEIAGNLLHPEGKSLTSEQLNQQLLLLCIDCPDPAGAMDIMIETRPPVTAEELVAKALACPARDIASVPESELPATHPLRHMKVDE